jgi:hypothetical protein
LAAVVILLGLSGCSGESPRHEHAGGEATNPPATDVSLKDVREETAEAVGTAVKLADQTQDEYVARLRTEIEDIGERLDALKTRGESLGEQAREAWDERIAQLTRKKEALQKRAANVAEATGDAWRELARGMARAREDVAQAVRKAEAEFTSESGREADPESAAAEE